MNQRLDFCKLARAYVDASNNHDLEVVEEQLLLDASYHSENVGRFEGSTAILNMMTGFFATYPDVTWQVDRYILNAPLTVYFEFSMIATNAQTGEQITREGLERIDFDVSGKIKHIDVGPRS